MADQYTVTPEAHDKATNSGEYPGQAARAEPFQPDGTPTPAEPAPEDATPPSEPVEEKDTEAPAEEAQPTEKAEEGEEPAAAPANFTEVVQEYTEEFISTGDLSSEARDAAAKKLNVPREVVDAYVEGQKALANSSKQAAFSLVGGEANYSAMTKWAAENLSEGEIKAFNTAVDQGGEMATFAIQGLHSRFSASGEAGNEPDLSRPGQPAAGSGNTPIQSRRDLVQLLRDPRYAKDANFRKEVDSRLAASMRSGRYRTD